MAKRLNEEEVSRRISKISNGSLEYVGGYKNKDEIITLKHLQCGSVFDRIAGNILHQKVISCPTCEPDKFVRTTDRLRSLLEERGIALISCGNPGDRYQATVKLRCGCISKRGIGALLSSTNSPSCRKCTDAKYKVSEHEISVKLKSLKYGSFTLVPEGRGTVRKRSVICDKCETLFKENISNLVNRGGKCKNCFGSVKSVKEEFVAILLNDLEINFQREFRIENKPFDFYLPSYNLLIEYDGEGHFRSSDESIFSAKNDEIKNDLAEVYGYSLLRIPYTESVTKTLLNFLERSTTIL